MAKKTTKFQNLKKNATKNLHVARLDLSTLVVVSFNSLSIFEAALPNGWKSALVLHFYGLSLGRCCLLLGSNLIIFIITQPIDHAAANERCAAEREKRRKRGSIYAAVSRKRETREGNSN
jgi:hypothetical protein